LISGAELSPAVASDAGSILLKWRQKVTEVKEADISFAYLNFKAASLKLSLA
jgi:hypothetical protein